MASACMSRAAFGGHMLGEPGEGPETERENHVGLVHIMQNDEETFNRQKVQERNNIRTTLDLKHLTGAGVLSR